MEILEKMLKEVLLEGPGIYVKHFVLRLVMNQYHRFLVISSMSLVMFPFSITLAHYMAQERIINAILCHLQCTGLDPQFWAFGEGGVGLPANIWGGVVRISPRWRVHFPPRIRAFTV